MARPPTPLCLSQFRGSSPAPSSVRPPLPYPPHVLGAQPAGLRHQASFRDPQPGALQHELRGWSALRPAVPPGFSSSGLLLTLEEAPAPRATGLSWGQHTLTAQPIPPLPLVRTQQLLPSRAQAAEPRHCGSHRRVPLARTAGRAPGKPPQTVEHMPPIMGRLHPRKLSGKNEIGIV